MKNIHLLPTDKPSRLLWSFEDKRYYSVKEEMFFKNQNKLQNQNIYITSDEFKKKDEWVLSNLNEIVKFCSLYCQNSYKKIVITTDTQLIKDGVQAIDDEFLEWFVKNPSCEEVEVEKDYTYGNLEHFDYKIIIPKEESKQVWKQIIETCGGKEEFMKSAGLEPKQVELLGGIEKGKRYVIVGKPKQETLEEAAEKYAEGKSSFSVFKNTHIRDFKEGAKWQSERGYSKEDMREMYNKSCGLIGLGKLDDQTENNSRFKELLEKIKNK